MPSFDNARMFQQFVDLLPFGAYVVDPARRVLYWNRRAKHITGFLSQEVVGCTCAEDVLAHCGTSGAIMCESSGCPLERVLRDGQPAEARLFLRHKQGHRVPVLVRALPLRDETGKIATVAEIFQEESAGPTGLRWITENIEQINIEIGLPSAVATHAQLQLSLAQSRDDEVAFLIEIENLHQMTVHRGKEMANIALRVLAQTVSRLLTIPHYLGCWTESRLLALVPNCGDELRRSLCNSLESTGSACGVTWWGERVVYRVKAHTVRLDRYPSLDLLLAVLEAGPAGDLLRCS